MEVAWRGPSAELQLSRGGGGPVLFAEMKKKRAWGVDAHKVVQLMMGQLQSTSSTDDQEINTTAAGARRTGGDEGDEVTLDLLGLSSAAAEAHTTVAGGTTGLFNLRPKLMNTDDNSSFLELELDPLDQQLLPRLPSDWKKCLDLKTGKMSFVNNTTGVTLDDDPRKQQPQLDVVAPPLAAHALLQERSPSPSSHSPRAHEFLRSKQSEILREAESLKTTSSSTSSSGGGSPRQHQQQQQQGTKSTRDMSCSKLQQQQQQMLSFSTGKRLWNLQLEDTNAVSLVKDTLLAEQQEPERSTNLELDLNLAAAAVPSSPSAPQQQQQEQSVCTMAMVQRALRRTEQQSPTAYRKRSELRISILPKPASAGGTGSPSFSSLTSARTSDQQEQQQQPTGWSLGSPSTSSTTTTSSAISSRSPRLDGGNQGPAVLDDTQTSKTACTTSAYVGEVESSSSSKKQQQQPASSEQLETASCAQLVMGACTHCLMYVMLEKSHPKCPRCSSDVLVNFAAAPSSAPTPAAATTTTTISSCIKRQRVAQA